MTDADLTARAIDRLRTNLRSAGIRFSEADLAGMAEKGFLQRPVALEKLLAAVPADEIPDYLSAWGGPQQLAHVLPAEGSLPGPPVEQDAAATPAGAISGSLVEAAAQVRAGEVSPVELVEQSLAAIPAHDAALNAFQLVLADQAQEAARQAEGEVRAGQIRGPLHGVPVAVKDLLALAGTPTTAGSRIMADEVADYDATGVERLRAAGAVIVGKTRMSEFAYSPGSNNAHYGPTRNPWNLEHDTGGSSSGSGAAVAAGLVYAALGSDTGGSIRIPAAQCGIVGLKPTFGRTSLYGAITLSWSQDHLGPLARTVADAALLLQVLAGPDGRDPRVRAVPLPDLTDLEAGAAGLRIGVLGDDGSGRTLGPPDLLTAWRSGLAALERGGATLVEIDLPEMEALRMLNSAIIAHEAAAYHEPWLRTRLDEYGEFMRQRILASYAYSPTMFVGAQQARAVLRRRVQAIFEQVDLLSTPTMPAGAPRLGWPASTALTGPFNLLGWPAITVPVGLTADGLPVGLQLAGRPWDEATVLRAARVVEAEGPWQQRRPPGSALP